MRLLGIDYGDKKIGLAISEGLLAEPIEVVPVQRGVSQILRICHENRIEKIVVGISEGIMAEKSREFAKMLGKATGLSVELWDETLTTQEAVDKMRQLGKKKKDEDAISAALILQAYLDNQFNNLTI